MENILLVINIILAAILVILVLLQKSEGGALGIGVSQDNFMFARSAGNFMTKATAIVATLFIICSLSLTILSRGDAPESNSVLDKIEEKANQIFKEIDNYGGVINGIEEGYFQREISASASDYQSKLDFGKRVMVGANAFVNKNEDVDNVCEGRSGRPCPSAREASRAAAHRPARPPVHPRRSALTHSWHCKPPWILCAPPLSDSFCPLCRRAVSLTSFRRRSQSASQRRRSTWKRRNLVSARSRTCCTQRCAAWRSTPAKCKRLSR